MGGSRDMLLSFTQRHLIHYVIWQDKCRTPRSRLSRRTQPKRHSSNRQIPTTESRRTGTGKQTEWVTFTGRVLPREELALVVGTLGDISKGVLFPML